MNIKIYNNTIATNQQPLSRGAAIRVNGGTNKDFEINNNALIVNGNAAFDFSKDCQNMQQSGNVVQASYRDKPLYQRWFTAESPLPSQLKQLFGYQPLPILKNGKPRNHGDRKDFKGKALRPTTVGAVAE